MAHWLIIICVYLLSQLARGVSVATHVHLTLMDPFLVAFSYSYGIHYSSILSCLRP